MAGLDVSQIDIFLLDDLVWIASAQTGSATYYFPFAIFFPCRHPWQRPAPITAVGRFGATSHYAEVFGALATQGVQLIHSSRQYQLASDLTHWYPLMADLTPRSVWFGSPPTAEQIEQHLHWPIFLKGSRQTSRHQARLSIIHSPAEYVLAMEQYRRDPILGRQPLVCREYVRLRPVPAPTTEMIPPSFEFRTFWWQQQCVGAGPYWSVVATYAWTRQEEQAAIEVAQMAARRLQLPFVAIDVAQTQAGNWIVIECNDGQESGYTGVAPVALWQNIVQIERERAA